MKPSDNLIALIIISTICAILVIVILSAAIRGVPLSEHGARTTGEIIVALIAIVYSITNRRKK
jgi:hypothetical protein